MRTEQIIRKHFAVKNRVACVCRSANRVLELDLSLRAEFEWRLPHVCMNESVCVAMSESDKQLRAGGRAEAATHSRVRASERRVPRSASPRRVSLKKLFKLRELRAPIVKSNDFLLSSLSLFFALLCLSLGEQISRTPLPSEAIFEQRRDASVSQLWHQPERPVFHYLMPTDFMFVFCLPLARPFMR